MFNDSKTSSLYPWHQNHQVMKPLWNGFQLLGDSQFLRFSEQLLQKTRETSGGLSYIGFCVSGQTTGDLLKRIESYNNRLTNKVILMIGTNDLIKNTASSILVRNINKLVLNLITKGVPKLVILTIPPVPRLAADEDHWILLEEYNKHLRGFHNGDDIFVVDAFPEFMKIDYYLQNPLSSPLFSIKSCIKSDANEKKRSDLSDGQYGETEHTSPIGKRSSHTSEFPTPNSKRKSCEFESFPHIVDRNEALDLNNLVNSSRFKQINLEYFEEFFHYDTKRRDLIHLNYQGLRLIEQLIISGSYFED